MGNIMGRFRTYGFRICVANFARALQAYLNSSSDSCKYWDSNGRLRTPRTLEEAFLSAELTPEYDPNGNIVGLIYNAEKDSSFQVLLRNLAPYIDAESYVEYEDEYGQYAIKFDGNKAHEFTLKSYE